MINKSTKQISNSIYYNLLIENLFNLDFFLHSKKQQDSANRIKLNKEFLYVISVSWLKLISSFLVRWRMYKIL